MHVTEINLATEKQAVLNLKVELHKVKEAPRVAKEVAKVVISVSYDRGVADMETHLAEEVAVVCRDYVLESWGVAMDRAGVPTDFKLRRLENIFFQKIFETP